MLILAYETETDGSLQVHTFKSIVGMNSFVTSMKLSEDAFAVFSGEVIKTFDGRLDLGRLIDSEGK